MKKHAAWIGIAAAGFAGTAQAGTVTFEDPGIFSPFDNAQVDIVWVESRAGFTGELSWVDSTFKGAPQTLWTNKQASAGQTVRLPRLFSQGDRVDLNYEVIVGRKDFFSTGVEQDWSQFQVDASDPLGVLVGVEDIRYPRGDRDHDDAVLRVVFSQAAVPAPGSLALLAGGCLALARRRR